MRIEIAGEKDVAVIEKLAHAIWPECYKGILSKSQLSYMLKKIYDPAALRDQMKFQQHQFIIIYDHNLPVGFADYSLKTENDPSIYRLNKIYVLTHLQGKGYGNRLLKYVCDVANANGGTILELNVNRYNPAVKYYLKNGFKIDHEDDIAIGEGYFMNDYIMRKNI